MPLLETSGTEEIIMAEKKTTAKAPAKKAAPKNKPPIRQPGTPNRDWTPIRGDYVTGDVTLPELAKKHDVSLPSVTHRCTNDKWVAARDSFRAELGRETQRKIAAKYAAGKAKDFDRLEKASDALAEQIENGSLEANSIEAATKGLIDVTKAKAAMAGDPIADKSELNVSGDVNLNVRRFKELTDDELDKLRRSLAAGDRRGSSGA